MTAMAKQVEDFLNTSVIFIKIKIIDFEFKSFALLTIFFKAKNVL